MTLGLGSQSAAGGCTLVPDSQGECRDILSLPSSLDTNIMEPTQPGAQNYVPEGTCLGARAVHLEALVRKWWRLPGERGEEGKSNWANRGMELPAGGSSSATVHSVAGFAKKARWRKRGWRAEGVCKE